MRHKSCNFSNLRQQVSFTAVLQRKMNAVVILDAPHDENEAERSGTSGARPSGVSPAGVPASLDRHATPAEAMAALEELTNTELLRLRTYARYRMRLLGSSSRGRDEEDLLSEAVTATLSGARRWNKVAVDLVGHLCGVMRSMSSHWAEHQSTSEITWTDADPEGEPPTRSSGDAPDAERQLLAADEVQRIRDYFAGDALVGAVLDAFAEGWRGPHIKQNLGLSQTAYETILKRLRRGVARMQRDGTGTKDHSDA